MPTDEQRMINAFIGFCRPMAGTWPEPLRELGYDAVGTEMEVQTAINGTIRQIVPDLICASTQQNHAFCLEVKSATPSQQQGEGYMALQPSDLYQQGKIPIPVDPPTLTLDCLYATESGSSTVLAAGMANLGIKLPVVAEEPSRFYLADGRIGHVPLNAIFDPELTVAPEHHCPTGFVEFTSKSDLSALAPSLIRVAANAIRVGKRVEITDIAQAAVKHWSLCGERERETFKNKFWSLLRSAAAEELKPFIRLEAGGRAPRVRTLVPKNTSPLRPARLLQLSRESSNFVVRQENGTPFRVDQPVLPGL